MQTSFSPAQLADPDTAESARILRACVHCGFCTATCPTYALLGDELDSPRGRIYLIKDMLENDRPATAQVVKHIDRCLSCLSCMTTCPSGVNYMHLVDHARHHIEKTYVRPWPDRALRRLLGAVLPGRACSASVCRRPGWANPSRGLMPPQLRVLLALAPARVPPASAGRRAAGLPGRRSPRQAGGAADRLRPAGAGAGDQRGHDPAAHAARLRGRRGARRGLLRRLEPSPRAGGARFRQGQYRGLDARDRGRGTRRHRDQCLGLRHHREGLRLHVPRRRRPGRAAPVPCRDWRATSPNS